MSKAGGAEEDSGHLSSQKNTSPEKSYHSKKSSSCKRFFTADETLFLFELFCKHHSFHPNKKDYLMQ